MLTFTILSGFVLRIVASDLSLSPLMDLRDTDGSTGTICRGLIKRDTEGEGRHVPGHLREAQFAIPIQVKHP